MFSLVPQQLESVTYDSSIEQDLFLIVDCSASMTGSQIEEAREASKFFVKSLKELPPKTKFNIIAMGTKDEILFKQNESTQDKQKRKSAKKFVSNLESNMGGKLTMCNTSFLHFPRNRNAQSPEEH